MYYSPKNDLTNEYEKFKKQFYDQMYNISHNLAREMCYMIAHEALSFVNNYPHQDAELSREAHNIAIAFLDSFEHKIFEAIESVKKAPINGNQGTSL